MKKTETKADNYRMNRAEKKEFYRELFSLAVPIGLQSLLVALIGATDALMLGRFSQDAVSGVSLANQIAFVMSLFNGSIIGAGGVLLAQYWGKGDKTMVKNLFCTVIKYAAVISLVFFALAMFLPEQLMRIFTPDPALIEIGASYLRVVAVSYLFTGVTQCYYTVMKLEGKAAKSVWISVATLVADMVLDFFLIYGVAGVPGLGADGSAYSTVAVELIALVWCIAESHRGESVHPDAAGFRWFSAEINKDILKITWPMLGSALAWGLSISMHSFIMGHLGSDATAAASITSVAQEIVTCVCKGIATGSGIMVGKLLGQEMFEKAKAYGRKFWQVSFVVGGIHMVLLAGLGPVVTRYFILTETARQYLVIMLIFTGLYVFAYSFNTVLTCGILPAGGDAKYDAVSVFIASWCFAIPLALLGTFVFQWPVMVIYIVMCSDEIVKLPWLYPRYKKFYWLKNLTREEN